MTLWVALAAGISIGLLIGIPIGRVLNAHERAYQARQREERMYPGGRPAPIRGVQPWHDMNEDPDS